MRKRGFLKKAVAIVALLAMVLDSSAVTTLASEVKEDDSIVVENTIEEEPEQVEVEEVSEEEPEDIEIEVVDEADSEDDADVNDEEVNEDVDSDDESENFDENSEENIEEDSASEESDENVEESEESENNDESVGEDEFVEDDSEIEEEVEEHLEINSDGIEGFGYDEISFYIDTDELDKRDMFRVEFTGPSTASYNPVINEDMDKSQDGYLDFTDLEKENFSISISSSDDIDVTYSRNDDGFPMAKLVSCGPEKVLKTRMLTTKAGKEISAIEGSGFDNIDISFNTEKLSENVEFTLYVESDAEVTVDGQNAVEGITGLSKDDDGVILEGLDEEEFIAYAVIEDGKTEYDTNAFVTDAENGKAELTIMDVASKTVYEFEDDKVYVRARIEDPEAIPDDAVFSVSEVYDSEEYIDLLNENADEEGKYTEDNTLVYDISFYTDESKSEEIEPEEGSVSISIEFKKNQLENELDADASSEIEITHFEEKGESIDPVVIESDASVEAESVEFVVDSFSKYAVTVNGKKDIKPGKSVTYADALGSATNYGIVANEMTLKGHLESNFAVGTLNGNADIQSCKNEGGAAGTTYIGEYTGSNFKLTLNGNSGILKIYTTEAALRKFGFNMTHLNSGSSMRELQLPDGVEVDYTSMSAAQIKSKVANIVSNVQERSEALYAEENSYEYSSVKNQYDNSIDLTSYPDGTYYISFDTSSSTQGKSSNAFPGNFTLRINKNQNVVFNIPDESVTFNQYTAYIGGKQYVPQGGSNEEILFEKLIFNCPYATEAKTASPVTGTFVLPSADFTNGSVAAGFLVANNILGIGGQEWHCISKRFDIVEDDEDSVDLDVFKTFLESGKEISSDKWPSAGFKFKISKYPYKGTVDGKTVESDAKNIPDFENEQVVIYSDTKGHKGSFGRLSFKGQSLFNNTNAKTLKSDSNTKYLSFMYKIEELDTGIDGITNAKPVYVLVTAYSTKVNTEDGYRFEVKTEMKTGRSETGSDLADESATFVNTFEEPYGSLEIKKSFEGASISDSEKNKISFVVSGPSYSKTIKYSELKNGTYTIDQLKPGKYSVKEINNNIPSGYTCTTTYKVGNAKANEGNEVTNVSIVSGNTETVSFINSYSYDAIGYLGFSAIKKLENASITDNKYKKAFSYTLSCVYDPMFKDAKRGLVSSTVSNNGSDISFGTLTYVYSDVAKTADRKYEYILKENIPTTDKLSGITYDSTQYRIYVTVTDNGDGSLTVHADVYKNGDETTVYYSYENSTIKGSGSAKADPSYATEQPMAMRPVFTNTYAADGELVITATKEFTHAVPEGKTFSFDLKKPDGTVETKTLTSAGTVSFTTIKYDLADKGKTYTYEVTEQRPLGSILQNDGAYMFEGIRYDGKKYIISATITDGGNGKLCVEKSIKVEGSKETSEGSNAVFTNDYSSVETSTDIEGLKTLLGKKLSAGDFNFSLEAANDFAKNPSNCVIPVSTASNDADGKFVFENIELKSVGTYEFLISESIPNDSSYDDRITYSKDEYIVTVVVKDNKLGELVVGSQTISKKNSSGSVKAIEFINTYNGEGEVQFVATKNLEGRALENAQFTFEVCDSEKVSLGEDYTSTNNASGAITFKKIQYSLSDLSDGKGGYLTSKDFVYYIHEVVKDKAVGYTYDEEYKKVTVTVVRKDDGSLSAIPVYDGGKAEFTNVFEMTGSVSFKGTKTLVGRKFRDSDSFEAVLYDSKGTPIDRDYISPKSSLLGTNEGTFEFTLNYDQDDLGKTYTYYVKEEGKADGVTNDPVAGTEGYKVYVTVNDDLDKDGYLDCVVTFENGTGINIVNTFNTPGSALISARKTLSGTKLLEKQFEFELLDCQDNNKVIDTASNKLSGTITFNPLSYTRDMLKDTKGTQLSEKNFEYIIREKAGTKAGYIYSSATYKAVVTVTDANDTNLHTSVKYYNSEGKEVNFENVVFENEYKTSGSVQFKITKTLKGHTMEKGQFTFELRDSNGKVIDTVSSPAALAGETVEILFPALTYDESDLSEEKSMAFDEDGTFAKYYSIREVVENSQEGYTFDDTEYAIRVTLKDSGNSEIDTDWVAYKSGEGQKKMSLFDKAIDWIREVVTGKSVEKNIDFVNSYGAKGKVKFAALKRTEGKNLKAGDFSFTLSGLGEDSQKINQSVSNDASGVINFSEITFTKPSESNKPYEFTISEDIPREEKDKKPGYTYDSTVYNAKVYVTDANDGTLNVQTLVYNGDELVSTTNSSVVNVAEKSGAEVPTGYCSVTPVNFKNTYISKPTEIVLGGTKSVANRNTPIVQKEFEFKIEGSSEDGSTDVTKLPEGYNNIAYVNADGTFKFAPIEYTFADLDGAAETAGGTRSKDFWYEISEIPGNDEKIHYSESSFKVKVTVTDNGDGTLSAKASYPDGDVHFVNSYNASNSVQFYATKVVKGTDDKTKDFTFKLSGDGIDAASPMTVTVRNGETKNFGTIAYSLDDLKGEKSRVYHYTIEEVEPATGSHPGYTYSKEQYLIDVTVTNDRNDGVLSVSYEVSKRDESGNLTKAGTNTCEKVVFTNPYNTDSVPVRVEGTKTLTGKDLNAGDFTFGLYNLGESTPIKTVKNTADGSFLFTGYDEELGMSGYTSALMFDQSQIGEHFFEIKEIIPDESERMPKVTYNKNGNVYLVKVTVSDLGDGTLTADTLISDSSNKNQTVEKASFLNVFEDENEISFNAVKSFTGKKLNNDEFSFTLEQTKGGKIADFSDDGQKRTVFNRGSNVTFGTIKFTQSEVGDYEFKIYENDLDETNVTYSKEIYTADVKVYVGDDGRLKAEKTVRNSEGAVIEKDSDVVFENKFESSVPVKFEGTKHLAGFESDSVKKGDYKFKIEGDKGTNLPEGYEDVVSVKANGKYEFGEIVYTEKDLYVGGQYLDNRTFNYVVREIIDGEAAPNVIYDDTVYNISVNVSLVNGELVAKTSVLSNKNSSVEADGLDFTNKYEDSNEWVPTATKTIIGKNLISRAYTFNLVATDANHTPLTGDKAYSETVENNGAAVTFTKINYSQADIGDHYYTITETASTDGSVKDSSVFYAKVTLYVDENNKLSKRVSYTKSSDGDSTQPEEIKFVNTFADNAQVEIGGKKIMIGKNLEAGKFNFVLESLDGPITVAPENAGALSNSGTRLTVTNTAAKIDDEGKASVSFMFPTILYTQDSLYDGKGGYLSSKDFTYKVYESAQSQPGVTNSTASYQVTVHLAYVDGKLTATKGDPVSLNPDSEEEGTYLDLIYKLFGRKLDIVFVNKYYAIGEWDPEGWKELIGRELKDGDFTFRIAEVDQRGKLVEDHEAIVTNVGNHIQFSSDTVVSPSGDHFLQYTIEDLYGCTNGRTYIYELSEPHDEEDDTDGITYDEPYMIYLKVTDNGDGKLNVNVNKDQIIPNLAQRIEIHGLEEELDDMYENDPEFLFMFSNTYNATGYIDFAGSKNLLGRDLTAEDKWSFTLAEETFDGKEIANPRSATVGNIMDSSTGRPSRVEFNHAAPGMELLNYDLKDIGVHTYIVSETFVDADGVSYDKEQYRITVNVDHPKDASGNDIYTKDLEARVLAVDKIISEYHVEGEELDSKNLFVFNNTYEAKGSITFSGHKMLIDETGKNVGNPSNLEEAFKFSLIEYTEPSFTVRKPGVEYTMSDANGDFKFGEINYTQEDMVNPDGTYSPTATKYYKVVETVPNRATLQSDGKTFEYNGIVYATNEYEIEVDITDNGKGELVTDTVILNTESQQNVTKDELNFTNKTKEYKIIEGKKYWHDNVTDTSSRPDVRINLYSSNVGYGSHVINTYVIKAPNMNYRFETDAAGNKLPAYTEDGKLITYSVGEETIDGYLSEKVGTDFHNTAGEILIRKINEETGETLAGATLSILTTGGEELETWVSDVSAHVVETTLDSGTTYVLREVSAPEGFTVAKDVTFVVPVNGDDITVTMEDKPIKGSVRLTKYDESTRELLAGAEFSLYTYDGLRVYATGVPGTYSYAKSTNNGIFAVGSSGTLTISNLPYGSYYFEETKAPAGYELNSDRISFSIVGDGETVDVTCLDPKSTGSVKLRKVNAAGTRSLEGAVFELYSAKPRSVGAAAAGTIFRDVYYRYGTYTTNEYGEIYVDGLPWDDYYFIEVSAPEGYEVARDVNGDQLVYVFTIGGDDASVSVDIGDVVNKVTEGIKQGVVGGVLGVRAKPTSGVLGVRVGPVTGDAGNIVLWSLLLMASIATIIVLLLTGKKKKKTAEE